jgi:hypothetical protein
MKPIFMTAFVPRAGAARGEIRFTWPEGTAESYTVGGELINACKDLEGRNWTLEQAARFQLGIALRQRMQISFACDSEDEVERIEKIVAAEFHDLMMHPAGRRTWNEGR